MMKNVKFLLLVLIIAANGYGQIDPKARCEVQDLAIAAALGDADAQYNLGVEFHKGVAVPQDLAKSAEFWKLAAKAGIISAYNNLGHLHYYGRGIKQNFGEGIRLWRFAATNGHPESQVHLGYAYSDGRFLKVDMVEAYVWAMTGKHSADYDEDIEMRKAILEMATELLDTIAPKLSKVQKIQAERKAKLYIAKYGKERTETDTP